MHIQRRDSQHLAGLDLAFTAKKRLDENGTPIYELFAILNPNGNKSLVSDLLFYPTRPDECCLYTIADKEHGIIDQRDIDRQQRADVLRACVRFDGLSGIAFQNPPEDSPPSKRF